MLAQSFFPGWQARIDGSERELLRANYAFTALVLPAGEHEVEIVHDPGSFGVGAWISLAAAAGLVKRGGRLLYATCSILPEENERVVEAFLAAHPGFALVAPAAALAGARIALPGHGDRDRFLRLRPDEHGTDAFFGALMERRE